MYTKIRFTKDCLKTAGLVIKTAKLADMDIGDVSRLFPMHESTKMAVFERSPDYDTFDAAFYHDFDIDYSYEGTIK